MGKNLIIRPSDWPCTLMECEPGFFTFNDSLCFKTEYSVTGRIEAYNCAGEYFWGGVSTEKEREKLIVTPCHPEWEG